VRDDGHRGHPWLLIAVVGAVAALTVPPLMALLRTTTPTPAGLVAAAVAAAVGGSVARWLARPRVAEKE
jgi:hypothetical protein